MSFFLAAWDHEPPIKGVRKSEPLNLQQPFPILKEGRLPTMPILNLQRPQQQPTAPQITSSGCFDQAQAEGLRD